MEELVNVIRKRKKKIDECLGFEVELNEPMFGFYWPTSFSFLYTINIPFSSFISYKSELSFGIWWFTSYNADMLQNIIIGKRRKWKVAWWFAHLLSFVLQGSTELFSKKKKKGLIKPC